MWLVGSGSGEMHGPRRRLLGATDKRSRPGAAGLVNVLLTFAHWGLSGVTRVTFLAASKRRRASQRVAAAVLLKK